MLHKVSAEHHIFVPVKNLDANGPVPKSLVVRYFLKQLSFWKAIEGFGYLLAVTKLKSIDNGKIDGMSKFVDFAVAFKCRTFLPVKGEVLVGVVHLVRMTGVLLKCGPANSIYLSVIKMPNYHYVPGQKPHFLSNDLSRIEKDVVVRFMVFATRWNQQRREIDILASLEGDGLGPVSLAGTEGVHFLLLGRTSIITCQPERSLTFKIHLTRQRRRIRELSEIHLHTLDLFGWTGDSVLVWGHPVLEVVLVPEEVVHWQLRFI